MPHLNELHEAYDAKGLTVLAVTSEEAEPTEEWVAAAGARSAYAYDDGGVLARTLGVKGIPHAVLVDPRGRIVWQGAPDRLTARVLEPHLAGALETPVHRFPPEAAGVAEALRQRRFAEAVEQARALPDPAIVRSLERLLEARRAALEAARTSGDFLTAADEAERMARELAGLPLGDEAKAIADALSGDPEVARVIRGQRAVRALKDVEVTGPAEAREVVGELLKIEESFAGTAAAREAAVLRAWVEPWLDEEDEDEEFDEDEPVGAPAAQTSSKENAARR